MTAVHRVFDPAGGKQVASNLCALGVMTKAPRAGRVKTRLTPPLMPKEAAALNICFLRDTTSAITTAVSDGLASGIAVYTPVGEEAVYADIIPSHFDLVPQRGGSFGERLICATEDLFQLGFHSVCLIDSDSPTVPARSYSEAAQILSEPGERLVLGPSDDGGYYLIGMNQLHRRVFEEIDWSTERVYKQTIERARETGLQVEILPTSFDVDDRVTLRRLCDELLGESPNTDAFPAPASRQFLEDLIRREGRGRIWPNE